MHSFMDSKILAKNLRQSLTNRGIAFSHSQCLELIAHQFGYKDWNQLSARITATAQGAITDNPPLPTGWRITRQTDHSIYRIGINADVTGTVQISCRFNREDGLALEPDSFASMMQGISASPYRGQKLVLEATIRTDNADVASIWMRVDQVVGQPLRFDNMLNRASDGALYGTNDWSTRYIILDIPENAISIHYGLLFRGYGHMQAKSLALYEALPGQQVTAGPGNLLMEPTNLSFLSVE